MSNEGEFKNINVVGAGLIGTSIALRAAQEGMSVSISDIDETAESLARDLLSSHSFDREPDLVVIATPPNSVVEVLKGEYEQHPKATFIDVSSVKTKVQHEVEFLTGLKTRFIGTHPMAGREIAGAHAAQSDLFVGRAWFVSPGETVIRQEVEKVKGFIAKMGASVYEMDSLLHDQLMAHISHLPQLISTALAASLETQSSGLELAGQGLRDMTRLAGSNGGLWSQILLANREQLIPAIDEFVSNLNRLSQDLKQEDVVDLENVFQIGNQNRQRIGGKHGAVPRNYSYLLIVIKDEPGALSDLFLECSKLNANIEDLSIEHSPGQLTGLITLAFSPEDAERVKSHLTDKDWVVHQR